MTHILSHILKRNVNIAARSNEVAKQSNDPDNIWDILRVLNACSKFGVNLWKICWDTTRLPVCWLNGTFWLAVLGKQFRKSKVHVIVRLGLKIIISSIAVAYCIPLDYKKDTYKIFTLQSVILLLYLPVLEKFDQTGCRPEDQSEWIKGLRREQTKLAANCFFIIFHYFMPKCLSKQRQSQHCPPLGHKEDTWWMLTFQSARFLSWSWETKPILICTHTHRFLSLWEINQGSRAQQPGLLRDLGMRPG